MVTKAKRARNAVNRRSREAFRAEKVRQENVARQVAEFGRRGIRCCTECACTDADCSGCIARTGEPCHWVGPKLCSACK